MRPQAKGTGQFSAVTDRTGVQVDGKVSLKGKDLQLQTLQIAVPADAGVRGLIFVIRSQDGSRWWRDGQPLL